jgi:hypothetical protein
MRRHRGEIGALATHTATAHPGNARERTRVKRDTCER